MKQYDLVREYEDIKFFSRFIPYSKGSPSEEVTFDDQYPRANFVFFTDSHVDRRDSERIILGNTNHTIEFVNNSPIKFDAVINGGDILSLGGLQKPTNLVKADSFLRLLRTLTFLLYTQREITT